MYPPDVSIIGSALQPPSTLTKHHQPVTQHYLGYLAVGDEWVSHHRGHGSAYNRMRRGAIAQVRQPGNGVMNCDAQVEQGGTVVQRFDRGGLGGNTLESDAGAANLHLYLEH
jgi:hypothetical protein